MPHRDPKWSSRNTNALAVVAGALIALIAVLAFLAVISHRGGAQEAPSPARRGIAYAAAPAPPPQLTVSVPALAL